MRKLLGLANYCLTFRWNRTMYVKQNSVYFMTSINGASVSD